MYHLKFLNKDHEYFFYEMLEKLNRIDVYRAVFFYVMGLTVETRENIKYFYNFRSNCIILNKKPFPWETSTTRKVCNLAYNLYGGYCDEKCAEEYTPSYLFCTPLAEYFIVAIRMMLNYIAM